MPVTSRRVLEYRRPIRRRARAATWSLGFACIALLLECVAAIIFSVEYNSSDMRWSWPTTITLFVAGGVAGTLGLIIVLAVLLNNPDTRGSAATIVALILNSLAIVVP